MSRKNSDHSLPERLLLSAAEVAALLGFSVRQIRRWDVSGRLPRPIVFKRRKKWRRSDVEAWVAAGCPA